jgi:hypothetical protein
MDGTLEVLIEDACSVAMVSAPLHLPDREKGIIADLEGIGKILKNKSGRNTKRLDSRC